MISKLGSNKFSAVGVLFIILLSSGLIAEKIEKIDIPLSKPGEPVFLTVNNMNGGIDIVGYSGKSLILEIQRIKRDPKAPIKNRKTKGMYRINQTGLGLTIEEKSNRVEIDRDFSQIYSKILLKIKTPFRTSAKLTMMARGDVRITGLKGDFVIQAHNGKIDLNGLEGSAIVNGMNGEIKGSFKSVDLGKPMSFSTFNGDIDIALPASAKYSIKMKSDFGEIYSGFKLTPKNRSTQKPKKTKSKSGKYTIKIDNTVWADLNGGGESLSIKTIRGNIYIRKNR